MACPPTIPKACGFEAATLFHIYPQIHLLRNTISFQKEPVFRVFYHALPCAVLYG
jgi:hypothetical protein